MKSNIKYYYLPHWIYDGEKLVINSAKINSVNPLYLIINEINKYIEEGNGNKYLTLVSTDESKGTLKKYEKSSSKIRDQIGSITNKSHDYDEKYKKIKFNSDGDLPLNKMLKFHDMVIVVRSFLHESNK